MTLRNVSEPKLAAVSEPVTESTTASGKALDRSLVRSVAWNAASDWGTQIFTWAAFLVIMRVLTPADFGIVALTMLLMPYLGQITGFGIPRAVVILRHLTDDQLAQLTTVNVISGCACFLLGIIIAKPFAAFFKIPKLAPVFIVGCSGLLTGAISGVSSSILAKDMRYRFLSILGIVSTLVTALLTLAMALLGFGYWSMVVAPIIAGLARTIVVLRVQPPRLAWPRFNDIREPLKFGWHVSVSMIALNSYQRLDNFVAGRVLGQTALGLYGNAWELANVPIEKVTSLVTTVIPTYLAAVKHQPAELRRYLRGLTEMIALASFPATIGLGLVAQEFVPFVFGHKWDGMIGSLKVLSFYAAFRSIVALLPKVLSAVGHVSYVMWNDLAAVIVLPIAFYIGSHRGIAGIAWGWVAAYPLVVLPLYQKTFQTIGMKVGEYLVALRPALTGTVVMVSAVELVKHSMSAARPLVVRLAIEIMVGALVYSGSVWLLHKDRVLALFHIARNLRTQKAPLASVPVV